MFDYPTTLIAYGFNKPEEHFCWTTHEFGIKVPPHTLVILTFKTYSRRNNRLHCFGERNGAFSYRLSDGDQAIRLQNKDAEEQIFHCKVEPKISYPSDVRDLGVLLLRIESEPLNQEARKATDPCLLLPEASDFRPRKVADVASILSTNLLRSFVDAGWLRTHLVLVNDERFVLEIAFYPPNHHAPRPTNLAFRINENGIIAIPVERPDDPARYILKDLPNLCYRGILDCSEFFKTNKEHLDIELIWAGELRFVHQSEHWRGLGLGPLPDASNIARVAGHISQHSFAFTGATWFVKLDRLAHRYVGAEFGRGRILDWGCGCARIYRFFPSHLAERLYGADIDGVNIDWCKRHYADGNFMLIRSNPPLPFPNCYFSLIYGHSVFTHLGENDQFLWLEELARVLSPGGLLFVTVMAELSWFVRFYPEHRTPEGVASYINHGFFDDGWLDVGVDSASIGSYRSVSHTEDYIRARWSVYFEVCEFIPGFADLQTLVILRKR